MEKKKATKNVWLYEEDYDFIASKVQYGEKFADAVQRVLARVMEKEDNQLVLENIEGEK